MEKVAGELLILFVLCKLLQLTAIVQNVVITCIFKFTPVVTNDQRHYCRLMYLKRKAFSTFYIQNDINRLKQGISNFQVFFFHGKCN